MKHGRAGKIDITLTEKSGNVQWSVANNGLALPPAGRPNGGMGLNVTRYRAGMVGGSLSIESGQRKGARVTCALQRTT